MLQLFYFPLMLWVQYEGEKVLNHSQQPWTERVIMPCSSCLCKANILCLEYLHGERNENQWFLRFDLPKNPPPNAPVQLILFFRCCRKASVSSDDFKTEPKLAIVGDVLGCYRPDEISCAIVCRRSEYVIWFILKLCLLSYSKVYGLHFPHRYAPFDLLPLVFGHVLPWSSKSWTVATSTNYKITLVPRKFNLFFADIFGRLLVWESFSKSS